MPRRIDHDGRRRDVAEITCTLIASHGVEWATVRRVAQAARCSTKVVSHYFNNKHELLLFAYRASADSSRARVNSVIERDPADLQGCLEALLPLDGPSLRDWQVWIAFWGMVVGDAKFEREHRRYIHTALQLLVSAMTAKWGQRAFGGRKQCEREARRLFALLNGIAVQAVMDPKAVPSRVQRRWIAAEIHRLTPSHL